MQGFLGFVKGLFTIHFVLTHKIINPASILSHISKEMNPDKGLGEHKDVVDNAK